VNLSYLAVIITSNGDILLIMRQKDSRSRERFRRLWRSNFGAASRQGGSCHGCQPVSAEFQLEKFSGAAVETIVRQAKIALSGATNVLINASLPMSRSGPVGEEPKPGEPEPVSAALGKLREVLDATYRQLRP
jgi:hypothetical protein